jgi:hypothetical protein
VAAEDFLHNISVTTSQRQPNDNTNICDVDAEFGLQVPVGNSGLLECDTVAMGYVSVSQTVVRGPQVVFGFCPCGPLRLNISPKKTEKIKLT